MHQKCYVFIKTFDCLIWIFTPKTPKITFLLFSWSNTKCLHLFYNFPLFGSSDDDFYNRLLFNISAAQMLLLLDPFCTSIGACSTVDRGNCIAPSFSSCLIDLSSRKTAKNFAAKAKTWQSSTFSFQRIRWSFNTIVYKTQWLKIPKKVYFSLIPKIQTLPKIPILPTIFSESPVGFLAWKFNFLMTATFWNLVWNCQ